MHRIVVALDPGTVVNPMSIEMQVQSAVVFGLTAAAAPKPPLGTSTHATLGISPSAASGSR